MQMIYFNGLTLGSSYKAAIPGDNLPSLSSQVEYIARRGRAPLRDAHSQDAYTFPLAVWTQTAGVTYDDFNSIIYQYFAPEVGERELRATLPSGGTVYRMCDVITVHEVPDKLGYVDLQMKCADPAWLSINALTDSSSPATCNGNAYSFPTISISPSTNNAKTRTITVQDNSGNGLGNYPCRVAIDTSGNSLTGAQNFIAYYRNRQIPIWVGGTAIAVYNGVTNTYHSAVGGTATLVDFRVDVQPNSTEYVYLFYGANINNTSTANKYDQAQFDYGRPFTQLNNDTVWFNNFTLSSAPSGASLVWYPVKAGQSISGVSYGLVLEGNLSCAFAVRPDDTLNNDADAMCCVIGSGAAASNAISGITAALTKPSGVAWGQNCVQTISLGTATAGVWKLNAINPLNGYESGAVFAFNAAAATIQTQLQSIFGSGNVTVSGSAGGPYTVTFGGSLASTDVPLMTYELVDAGFDGQFSVTMTTVGAPARCRMFFRYRIAGQLNWTESTNTTTTPGTYSSALVDIPNAVEVVMGIEPLTADAHGTVTFNNAFSLTFNSAKPTVSVSSPANAHAISAGTVTVGSRTCILGSVFLLSGSTLQIDTYNQQVDTLIGDIWFYESMRFSDIDLWLPLVPGSNTFSGAFNCGGVAVSATTSLEWRDRYLFA